MKYLACSILKLRIKEKNKHFDLMELRVYVLYLL